MTSRPHSRNKIARALKLLDEAAAARGAELASLLNNKYAALKTVIMESGNGAARAFGQGEERATETAGETDNQTVEGAVEAYEHAHRN